MKTKLLYAGALLLYMFGFSPAQTDANGYTTVELSMGAQYANRVFYDFSENHITSQPADSWDIAFYRVNAYTFGSRINDYKYINVYEASDDPEEWDNIDLADIDSWGDPLYAPDKTENIAEGAFEQGSATYGWGEYNGATHHIEGKVVFVLEYSKTNEYYKFMITDYYGGYTVKYAKWNGSSWGDTVAATIANGTDDAYFNYFSLATGAKVPDLEPAKAQWDLMFTKFWTDYQYPGGSMMYNMSGVLQNPDVEVAKSQPENQDAASFTAPAEDAYSSEISAIGYSWKPTSGIYTDVVYYVKRGDQYYRMYFTSNGGASTGNMFFKYKNITRELGVENIGNKASFGIYPNPVNADRKVTILFDVKGKDSNRGTAEIYDMSGKKVYETALSGQSGFYKQEVNLQKLVPGIYIVKITYGGISETKKLMVK
ncbi:T9SS type A sorting domain-containing protein [Daejeonia sp. YH14]|uniref:T9SS type A sorting domain-containing protein n=1 Tax=Daejeonia sp. YH14 TaxID=3439042 RepID=UPI003F499794